MDTTPQVQLDLHDIQGFVLRDRPTPYFGTTALLQIKDADQGRQLLTKLKPLVPSADNWQQPTDAAVAVALTFEGLKALEVPQQSLDSFPDSFKQGMAARAPQLRDTDENAPSSWEKLYGQSTIHLGVTVISDSQDKWQAKMKEADDVFKQLPGIVVLGKADFAANEDVKNVFGFRDLISNPAVEGSGVPPIPTYGRPIKAGEFLLGYAGESGSVFPTPQPPELGKNGTYLVYRKYDSKVAEFNQFLHDNADTEEAQELLAAKMFGRWRSGAPLTLAPDKDDPKLGSDAQRNNNFSYKDDQHGQQVPLNSHMRRLNPRDTQQAVMADVNLHRIIRRSVTFGTPLLIDQTQDDGQPRGQYFMAISAKAMDTIEFLQSQWVNDANFINQGDEKDPIAGLNKGEGTFTVPQQPIRRRYHNIHTFNVLRGGAYFFIPSLSAIDWLSKPQK